MEGQGLGLDLPSFIGQLVNFLLLLAVLMIFAFKPIRKVLDERAERIKKSMELAEATKKEYERAQSEVQKRIQEAQKQGEALLAEARSIGDRLKEEAKEGARREAQSIVEKAQADLKRDQDKMIDNLRREFAGIALLAAEKVIHETLDKEKHLRVITETLQESALGKKVN